MCFGQQALASSTMAFSGSDLKANTCVFAESISHPLFNFGLNKNPQSILSCISYE